MSSVMRGNVRMALASVRSNRGRSLLTMLGIVIGIVAVVVSVGIGEGVKREIAKQIDQFGSDLITVRPGKVETNHDYGSLLRTDLLFGSQQTSGLTMDDLQNVQKSEYVRLAAPMGVVSGIAQAEDGRSVNNGVIATNGSLPEALNKEVYKGDFFTDEGTFENAAVLGYDAALELFDDPSPLGHKFTFRDNVFVVRGIFDKMPNTPLTPTTEFNHAIFIPAKTAQKLTNNGLQFYSILAKPDLPRNGDKAENAITQRVSAAHGGQEDFSVLNRDETLDAGGNTITLLNAMILAIALLSLILGGVGIMNIMLVSVTERMHEIGIRKAIGATKRQILSQFMLEAITLGIVGGLVGIVVSIAVCLGLSTYTDLKPIISWPAVGIASGVSIIVGVIFGTAPAIKAARKDPIDALRHE